jgi:hypothetical protein
MRRAHDPSGLRRRGLRCRRHPQHQTGDAGGLCGQCEFARGDQIELARLAPDFQHHGRHRIAGQRVGGGPQHAVDISRAHAHQLPGVEAEFGEPAHRQRARFNGGEILPHPDQRPARRHPPRKPGDESGSRSALMSLSEHLMHRADGKTALQGRIRIRMTERDLAASGRFAMIFKIMRLEAFDAAAQTRKRAHACANHRAASSENWTPPASLNEPNSVNRWLAHLFMICSNIKLTGPAESIELALQAIQ